MAVMKSALRVNIFTIIPIAQIDNIDPTNKTKAFDPIGSGTKTAIV